jgi:hypothetical protein
VDFGPVMFPASTPHGRCRTHRNRTLHSARSLQILPEQDSRSSGSPSYTSSLKEWSRDTCNQPNHPHLRPNAVTIESLVPTLPRRLCASTRNPSDRKHLRVSPRSGSLCAVVPPSPAVVAGRHGDALSLSHQPRVW